MDNSNSMTEVDTQARESPFEDFMQRPTTLPVDLVITLTNFADEQDAHRCGDVLRGYLQVFGRLMNLSGLDRVYVTFDYEGTLASLDRGSPATSVLIPTNDEIATGVAMTPAIKREDGWKSVIVINAAYARSLSFVDDGSAGIDSGQLEALRAETIHILAHECGHVHDHTAQTEHLPPDTNSHTWCPLDLRLKEPAMACWSEYIAEYLSAGFGTQETLSNYENSFCDRLKAAWPSITKAVRQYRMHRDVDQVISEVGLHIRHVLTYASYLLGYLSSTGRNLNDDAPRSAKELELHPEMGAFIKRLKQELETLHERYPKFTSLDVFNPMSELIHDMYKRAGLTFAQNEEGALHVDIPLRAETLPDLQEQIEFRLKQVGQL